MPDRSNLRGRCGHSPTDGAKERAPAAAMALLKRLNAKK
jgi:hypothetical protein